jgi:hypothetical protein
MESLACLCKVRIRYEVDSLAAFKELLGRQRNIRATSTAVQIKRDGDCCRYRNDKDSICSMKNLA